MCCGHKRSGLRSGANLRPPQVPQGATFRHHQIEPLTLPSSELPIAALAVQPEKRPTISPPVGSNRAAAPITKPHFSVNLRYVEAAPIRVRGSVSGRLYEFSGAHPVQPVDARDATHLLQTKFFRSVT